MGVLLASEERLDPVEPILAEALAESLPMNSYKRLEFFLSIRFSKKKIQILYKKITSEL